jgi:ring-1,2-phenylacetyl-CoA epoxidase subunit PaaE
MVTYTLKVEYLKHETDDTLTICFKQPALKKVKYYAGQYLTLIFRVNGRRYIRPYSFSSAPGVDNTLNITVKRVLGGVVSNHIIDNIRIGDLIEVIKPMGDFTISNAQNIKKSRLVLWGSGSGITPLISLIKYALHENIGKHITLVYGNRSFETTIFSKQIEDMKLTYPNRFSVWHFHTRAVVDDFNPHVIQGRINPEKVLSVMQQESDITDTLHYICGPIGLKDSIKSVLFKLGVRSENIFSEDFEIVRNPIDFEFIISQKVTIQSDNQNVSFEVVKGKSILEAGLDASLDLSYSCQTGSCLLCKAQIITGEVRTIGLKDIPKELAPNECLLCCSFPLTANVKLAVVN